MLLAGLGGIYEILLIVLVVVLIFNGLKRQKIMNKVDLNLVAHSRLTEKEQMVQNKKKIDESEYVEFEEKSE